MEKFKVGDKVKVERIDPSWDGYVGDLDMYIGKVGIITYIYTDRACRVDFTGDRWKFLSEWLTLIPDTPSWLPLKVGKFYKLRNGDKAKIYEIGINNHTEFGQIFGAFLSGKEWFQVSWSDKGKYNSHDGESLHDIIGPWIERPTMDFSVLPAWWKSIAMNRSGRWVWSSGILEKNTAGWNVGFDNIGGYIPPEHCPVWDGPWEESLVVKED